MPSRPSTAAPILAALAIVLVKLGAYGPLVAEEPFDPKAEIRAALNAFDMLHLSRKLLDPPLARRWHTAFLGKLDPRRMYFLEEDVVSLQPSDEYASDPQKHFKSAVAARDLFRKRISEALVVANDCLTQAHDFSLDERCPRRYDSFAKTKEELGGAVAVANEAGDPAREGSRQHVARYHGPT